MAVSVVVNGAKGRMGRAAVAAIQAEAALTLVGEGDRDTDLAALLAETQPDVVLDLTVASAAFSNAETIINAGATPVIGTSGLLAEQITALQAQCEEKKMGGLIVPNFSIGAVLMMRFAKEAARYLPDVEIIEWHHDGKQDSPSGTSLHTAEAIASGRTKAATPLAGRETIPGARGANHHDVAIHAIRLPGLVAHQSVVFGGQGETLTIRHDSLDRQSFMPGICLACQKASSLPTLAVGLEAVLE